MTPLESYPELAAKVGFPALYFKREDLHPYGSHKGRSIPPMIDHYYAAGDRKFAVSSSGNAALAAAMHIAGMPDVSLDIFVGNHISAQKLERIRGVVDGANAKEGAAAGSERMRILKKERPLQALSQAADEGARSLRQSTDDVALEGYESLAREIADAAGKDKEDIGAVFIGTSSGTTAQALADFFCKKKLPIQVHIIQTSSCHPIAEEFEAYDGPEEASVADAIVDQAARRKGALAPLISMTGGHGWIASNDDISTAQVLAQEHARMTLSTNSALSIVGAMKAAYTGHEIHGGVICMICGE